MPRTSICIKVVLKLLTCYMDYRSGADRSLLERRFDAVDPELVALSRVQSSIEKKSRAKAQSATAFPGFSLRLRVFAREKCFAPRSPDAIEYFVQSPLEL